MSDEKPVTMQGFVGFATLNGTLHLFRGSGALRQFMEDNARSWGQIAWADSVVIHGPNEGRRRDEHGS